MTTAGTGWTPGARHWIATFAVAMAGTVIAAIALFKPASTITPPAVSVTNSINVPDVNGSPQQADPDANKGDSVCGDGSEKVAAGWGPERPLYHGGASPYVTINSGTANEDLGDERGFYGVKDTLDVSDGMNWHSRMKVERDHLYTLRITIVNDAEDFPYNVAESTKVKVSLPTCTGKEIPTNAFIVSYDAYPAEIWGGVTLISDELFNLAYVEGSARLYPFGANSGVLTGGIQLTADLLTQKGQLVGSDANDGKLRPNEMNAVAILFEVRPQFAPR